MRTTRPISIAAINHTRVKQRDEYTRSHYKRVSEVLILRSGNIYDVYEDNGRFFISKCSPGLARREVGGPRFGSEKWARVSRPR